MRNITEIPNDSTLRVIDFYAGWCGHCREIKPFLEEEETKNPDIEFCLIDVDTVSSDVLDKFDIEELPFVVAMKNGEIKSVYKEGDGSLSSWISFIKW
jgi:thioredoxin 1